MLTINPTHLGDGAYVGRDPNMGQVWLGANNHRNMSVALGPYEIRALVRWLCRNGYEVSVRKGMNDGS